MWSSGMILAAPITPRAVGEATGQGFRGERRVAAEAMKDAMQSGKLVEDGEQIWEGIAGVEHHGLLHFLCQAEHLAKHLLLIARRNAMVVREMVVEPDLAHRDHARMAGQLPQLSPLCGTDRSTGRVWVPPDCRFQARDALCEFHPGAVVRGIVADVEHGVHSRRSRLFERLLRGERLPQAREEVVRTGK